MLKRLIFVAVAAVVLCGCRCNCSCINCKPDSVCGQATLSQSFNDEQYVWEDFIFSTNRVDKAD